MSKRRESGMREIGMMTVIEHMCSQHEIHGKRGYCFKCGEIFPSISLRRIPWDEVPTLELQEVQVNPKQT